MPTYRKIDPSQESKQQLAMPITVVCRAISADLVVDKHWHSWGQFVYASKGVMLVATDSDRYIIPPEQGVWLPPEIVHEVAAVTDIELTSFYFQSDLLNKLPEKSCVLAVNEFLKALILEAIDVPKNYDWSGADGLLLKLIVDRVSSAERVNLQLPFPKDARLLTMLSMIQKEASLDFNLAQWGKIVGASSRTLSRLFKQETGLTYKAWRQRLNTQLAISQLGKGDNVTNISEYLGYESPSAFIHMFKKNTGMTPNLYREKYNRLQHST